MRAGLPFAITQGFSPHMRIAFGPALPVGVASQDEWFDLMIREYIPAPIALDKLQRASVEDLMPQEAAYVGLRETSLSAALTISCWHATMGLTNEFGVPVAGFGNFATQVQQACDEIVEQGQITYLRNGKPKTVSLEGKIVKPIQASVHDSDTVDVTFVTRSSNAGSLRPDVLMEQVCARCRALLTAERERGSSWAELGVSSHAVNVRARIMREAQYLESEDDSWHRPIRL